MNQVQNKIDKSELYIRQNESVNPFGQNAPAAIIYKRIERIVVAVTYIATQIKDSEVLRSDTHRIASDITHAAIVLHDGFHTSIQTGKVEVLLSHMRHLLTHIDMLRAAGALSDSNLELLKGAIVRVTQLLQSSCNSPLADNSSVLQDILGKGHEAIGTPQEIVNDRNYVQVPAQSKALPNPRTETSKAPLVLPKPDIAKQVHLPRGNDDRRAALLAVIEARGAVTIRDLVAVVPGISEKTIQRELLGMIQDGILVKEGERRWTTYSKKS
jgi:hypothetical protein